MEVRRIERMNAHLWHIRSRSTWFKIGDAPRCYFFILVTTKRIRETIKKLALPDGRITKDENEILHGVFSHHRKLYKRDPRVALFRNKRDDILRLITKRFSLKDNLTL